MWKRSKRLCIYVYEDGKGNKIKIERVTARIKMKNEDDALQNT